MLYWLYDIPTLLAVGLFAAIFVGVCWIGIVVVSPRLVPLVHHRPGLNEILGDYLQYFGVIYGLLLGLLAVATYQNHTDVEKAVANEASSLAALYRDIIAYPEPEQELMTQRRFPQPWSIEQTPGGYKVNDATGRSLAYVYGRADADMAKVLTMDEARRIASNITLPQLLKR